MVGIMSWRIIKGMDSKWALALTAQVHGVPSPVPSTEKPFARRSMLLRDVGMIRPACAAAEATSVLRAKTFMATVALAS